MGEPVAYTCCGTDTSTLLESITEYSTRTYSWLGRKIIHTNNRESIIAGTTIAFLGTLILDLSLIRTVASSNSLALLGVGTFTAISLLTVAGTGAYCCSKATNTEDIEATIALIDAYDESSFQWSDDNQTDTDNSTDDYHYSTDSPDL